MSPTTHTTTPTRQKRHDPRQAQITTHKIKAQHQNTPAKEHKQQVGEHKSAKRCDSKSCHILDIRIPNKSKTRKDMQEHTAWEQKPCFAHQYERQGKA